MTVDKSVDEVCPKTDLPAASGGAEPPAATAPEPPAHPEPATPPEPAAPPEPPAPRELDPDEFSAVSRNRLISMLLQDRGVTRVISAPHGFGKTTLAEEYAVRMFDDAAVYWVDAQDPTFLAALDSSSPALSSLPRVARPSLRLLQTPVQHQVPSQATSALGDLPLLVVLDDLPALSADRATALRHLIDTLLYRGAEVMVTTLPSTDSLRDIQEERLEVHACDLLVSESECLVAQQLAAKLQGVSAGAGAPKSAVAQKPAAGARKSPASQKSVVAGDKKSAEGTDVQTRAERMWQWANETFMGRVPAVCWGAGMGLQLGIAPQPGTSPQPGTFPQPGTAPQPGTSSHQKHVAEIPFCSSASGTGSPVGSAGAASTNKTQFPPMSRGDSPMSRGDSPMSRAGTGRGVGSGVSASTASTNKTRFLPQDRGAGAASTNKTQFPPMSRGDSPMSRGDSPMSRGGTPKKRAVPPEAVKCLRGVLAEDLRPEMLRAMLGMLLLGQGSAADLERAGAGLSGGDAAVLQRDYPFCGLDVARAVFEMPLLPVGSLREAAEGLARPRNARGGGVSLEERVLAVLLDRGDICRTAEVLEKFCTDEQCAAWLESRGWELLDLGEFELVETLMSRCPEDLGPTDSLCAMRAWACGLQGEGIEARHFARKVLARTASERDDRLLATIAMLAFGDDADGALPREAFNAESSGVVTPLDFLASVTDLCTDVEMRRALCADNSEVRARLERQREPATGARPNSLANLFTANHERLWRTLAYRLSLHVLAHVDDVELKKLLQRLGCDLVVELRRDGLRRFSEALVVRDLWKSGYFGLVGPAGSKRDAKLLESAARMLATLAEQRDATSADIPWEVAQTADAGEAGAPSQRGVRTRFRDSIALMHVRLFGCFEVSVGDRLVRERDFRRKGRLAFSILAINQGRDVSRDTLLKELWPSMPRTRAIDNFYGVWSNITSAVGDGPYLEKCGDFLRLNMRYVVSDVDEFERVSRQLLTSPGDTASLLDVYAHIESLYRGSLVPSETGNDFLNAQRKRYLDMFVDSMVAASACALSGDDARLGLWFARKAMDADARREDVYCSLIRAQMAAGQRCTAIRTYLECQKFLRDELGLDPSFETQDLYDRLITNDPSLLALTPESFGL